MFNVISYQWNANENQVKYHFTLTRMVSSKRQTATSKSKNVDKLEPLYIVGENMQSVLKKGCSSKG